MSDDDARRDERTGTPVPAGAAEDATAGPGEDGEPEPVTPSDGADAEDAEDGADASGGGEDDGAGEEEGKGKAEGKPPRSRRRKVLRRTALALAVLVALAAAGAGGLYVNLMGDVKQQHVTSQLGTARPKKLNKSLNILLLGSDTRAGDNARYGAAAGISGARSDTTILLHLSPNRDQAVGVSFPRDSMVKIPECRRDKGGTVPAQFGMLNAAFAYAGPTCTWKTLESLTGVHIDHFVQVDFSGFKRMVDALGGVQICVPEAVHDPRAELDLKAGKQVVKGDAALGYVRARYSLGDGGDLGRIERQQKFMASVVDKATSTSTLTDPAKSYKFLKAVAKSVTTDDGLDLPEMRKLASGLKGMSAGQVRFVTVPVKEYRPDPNRVQWDADLAAPLFQAIREDNDLPAEPVGTAAPEQAPPKPAKVNVTLVDAGAPPKAVRRIAARLAQRGYHVAKKVEKAAKAPDSKIVYGPAAEAQASALARDAPNALLTPDPKGPAGGVRLLMGGAGFQLRPPAVTNIAGGVRPGQNLCE
ncbi:LCP family protein [Actinomadura parmotrematis]|uniref:LCP family protein n=1 Tax=Actinomadura parmotrematis TaxID=2864039 RepID=A0ABS7FMM1_9ACTN|nr:LCP family protein [Actinomadura parmotrematis]MBW8481480.1 LCP family protein [Actinomadura parmotrematis]